MILFPFQLFSCSLAINRLEKATLRNNLLKELSATTKEIICRETKLQVVDKFTPAAKFTSVDGTGDCETFPSIEIKKNFKLVSRI